MQRANCYSVQRSLHNSSLPSLASSGPTLGRCGGPRSGRTRHGRRRGGNPISLRLTGSGCCGRIHQIEQHEWHDNVPVFAQVTEESFGSDFWWDVILSKDSRGWPGGRTAPCGRVVGGRRGTVAGEEYESGWGIVRRQNGSERHAGHGGFVLQFGLKGIRDDQIRRDCFLTRGGRQW